MEVVAARARRLPCGHARTGPQAHETQLERSFVHLGASTSECSGASVEPWRGVHRFLHSVCKRLPGGRWDGRFGAGQELVTVAWRSRAVWMPLPFLGVSTSCG